MPKDNLPLLFAAFAVTWGAFFIYLLFLSWRQSEVRKDLDELKRALEEKRSKGDE